MIFCQPRQEREKVRPRTRFHHLLVDDTVGGIAIAGGGL